MKCEFMLKHSLSVKLICNPTAFFLILAILIGGSPHLSKAQMFSVGDDRGPNYNIPRTELTIGLEPVSVTHEGDQGVDLFAFEGPIIRLGYSTPNLKLFFGTGGAVTGIDDVSYFDVGGEIDFGIRLHRSEKVALQLPVRISSRYVNMTNNEFFQTNINNYFRFGSLTAGAGIQLLVRPKENIRIEAGAVPGYGFAFASGGFFGGSLGSVDAHSRFYVDRLWGDFGLSIGYKYNLRNYNIDEDVYDYRMSGHLIALGITF